MNEKKILVSLVVATLLLIGGGAFFLMKTMTAEPISASESVKVAAVERNFDWGEIRINGGNATKTFLIKNDGTDNLKLYNIKTSCTCTKAQVEIEGVKSPLFSMHSTSSWRGEVLPGREAKLTVIFDPAFHGPSGIGPITRLVSVDTNDPRNLKLEFNLTAKVVQ